MPDERRRGYLQTLKLRDARAGKLEIGKDVPPAFDASNTALSAIAAFLAVNLLGFFFIGVRALIAWIKAGFAP